MKKTFSLPSGNLVQILPESVSALDPDLHWIRIRIRIRLKCWIRIRIRIRI
jgi:hypothetical protein